MNQNFSMQEMRVIQLHPNTWLSSICRPGSNDQYTGCQETMFAATGVRMLCHRCDFLKLGQGCTPSIACLHHWQVPLCSLAEQQESSDYSKSYMRLAWTLKRNMQKSENIIFNVELMVKLVGDVCGKELYHEVRKKKFNVLEEISDYPTSVVLRGC